MTPRVVLASGSPRRRRLLAGLLPEGASFDVIVPAIGEDTRPGESPETLVRRLARDKAHAVWTRLRDGGETLVLAADTTVVTAEGEILGKPLDAADARRMLALHSGSTHRVLTGVALAVGDPSNGGAPTGLRVKCATTAVTMRPLGDDEIDAYVASGEPLGKAGGYAIQEQADRFVSRVDGSWTNVVGLPTETVGPWLVAAGFAVREAV